MKNVSVIAFYSFFRIDNLELLENQIQDFLQPIDIKGTILIGPEGLNGTIAIPLNEEKNYNIGFFAFFLFCSKQGL